MVISPSVYQIKDDAEESKQPKDGLAENTSQKTQETMLQLPMVYIRIWKNAEGYEVYTGESNNTIQRIRQYYDSMSDETKQQYQLMVHTGTLHIVGHEHFNKSLTLNLENRLMLHMMSVGRIKKIRNVRGNPQNKYYPDSEVDNIFHMMWSKLHRSNKYSLPSESSIKDSTVSKASPLHELTSDQEQVEEIIIERVSGALPLNKKSQLILIGNEAGTGKVVLNSSIFYELFIKAENQKRRPLSCYTMVNHDEQRNVYPQIA